jgi:SAM-dependent methyltransferase
MFELRAPAVPEKAEGEEILTMADESAKAMRRRAKSPEEYLKVFSGEGIDVGCGDSRIEVFRPDYPRMGSVRLHDIKDGDAQKMENYGRGVFGFVHSSHCLEHMRDPVEAVQNWLRILEPGGHLVVCVPDAKMYEKYLWPSRFNHDHKTMWRHSREVPPTLAIVVPEFLAEFSHLAEIVSIKRIYDNYDLSRGDEDQTR